MCIDIRCAYIFMRVYSDGRATFVMLSSVTWVSQLKARNLDKSIEYNIR